MQHGSVYRMALRLTSMSPLFMFVIRQSYCMTDVKLAILCNNHLCHLTAESWCSYGGGKKQYWAAFHFWASQLWEKDISITSNHKSDIKQAITTTTTTTTDLYSRTRKLMYWPLHSSGGWVTLPLKLIIYTVFLSTWPTHSTKQQGAYEQL